MFAVVKIGGKQYKVSPGDKIEVAKIEKPEGRTIVFKDVLLLWKDKKLKIGTPIVKQSKVKAKILKHGKSEKKIIFKYKPKKRYKIKKGHRQLYTTIEVVEIN